MGFNIQESITLQNGVSVAGINTTINGAFMVNKSVNDGKYTIRFRVVQYINDKNYPVSAYERSIVLDSVDGLNLFDVIYADLKLDYPGKTIINI